ncbi:MAG: hypothetical protein HY901_27025 [Deltaproteobacteria bacterium]|nr:hypothetical protein [Deltaproteobacteria bacterium]
MRFANVPLRRLLGVLVACTPLTACSFLMDSQEVQCSTDDDCIGYEDNHPFCRNGICVPSGFRPAGCYYGTPSAQAHYLNACSTAQCEPYDNCARLGLCDATKALPPTVGPPDAGSAPSAPDVGPDAGPDAGTDGDAGATEGLDAGTSVGLDAGPGLPKCSNGMESKVIYMTGAADFPPLLQKLQQRILKETWRGVFVDAASCVGVNAAYSRDPAKRKIQNKPAYYYDYPDANKVSCSLDKDGNIVDVGVSDLFPETCSPDKEEGVEVGDYRSAVVAFTIAVSKNSDQESISAEALRLIFGNGGRWPDGREATSPWTDPKYFAIRTSGAASTVLASAMSGVTTPWWGVDAKTTDGLRSALYGVPTEDKDKTVGVLSIDYLEKGLGKENLKPLYLQAPGQLCGYVPNSTRETKDKINVRDGHYPLWGYLHFLVRKPNSPGASAFLEHFTRPNLDQALLEAIIENSIVPLCAMRVSRSKELTAKDPADFSPASGLQCHCFFDSKTSKTSCKPCTEASQCPAETPACNYGYCEKR